MIVNIKYTVCGYKKTSWQSTCVHTFNLQSKYLCYIHTYTYIYRLKGASYIVDSTKIKGACISSYSTYIFPIFLRLISLTQLTIDTDTEHNTNTFNNIEMTRILNTALTQLIKSKNRNDTDIEHTLTVLIISYNTLTMLQR